jgi:hypothetical protein
MTITQLIKFLWDGVDIPITKDEIQHSINVAIWALKKGLSEDDDFKKLNDAYKISCYDEQHKLSKLGTELN